MSSASHRDPWFFYVLGTVRFLKPYQLKGSHPASDAVEHSVMYFMHRPWLIWNQDSAVSPKLNIKHRSTRCRTPGVLRRLSFLTRSTSITRKRCVGLPHQRTFEILVIGLFSGAIQCEYPTKYLRHSLSIKLGHLVDGLEPCNYVLFAMLSYRDPNGRATCCGV